MHKLDSGHHHGGDCPLSVLLTNCEPLITIVETTEAAVDVALDGATLLPLVVWGADDGEPHADKGQGRTNGE